MKNNIILFLLSGLAVTSCNPKYYVPNTQNVPLLSEKEETSLNLSGNGNQVEFQGAYAISDGFALQANGGLFIPPDLDNGNGGSGNFIEVGAGYYTKTSESWVFETYGLLGFGSFENHLPSTVESNPNTMGDISSNIFRVGIQPSFGYKSPNFSAAISSRIVNLSYNNIEGDLIFNTENQVAYLTDNSSHFLIEPAITLRAGLPKAKFQLQYIYSANLSTRDFKQDQSLLSLGLHFNFK